MHLNQRFQMSWREEGTHILSKMQLDCTPKPIQLLSKSTPIVNKSPEYTQQTGKEENA